VWRFSHSETQLPLDPTFKVKQKSKNTRRHRNTVTTRISASSNINQQEPLKITNMASLDPHVAKVLDRQQPTDSDDEDALIAELEDEESHSAAFAAMREQRLQQLHAELNRAKIQKEASFGTYQEIKDEKQLMEITTGSKYCVVHFMKPDFNRCRIMDEKLKPIAEKHYETRILSINVENAAFLVVKLGIQVLPCVISFIDGVGVDRIIGFEGLGTKPDTFKLAQLEDRLLACGVLARAKITEGDERMRVKQARAEADYDDDEWD
jgi:thiol-disulfide isomerase/thioredoxin